MLSTVSLSEKRVIIRVDYNVPIEDGDIVDNNRGPKIPAKILKELMQENAAIVSIMTQLLSSKTGRRLFARFLRALAKLLRMPMAISGSMSGPMMDRIRQEHPRLGEVYDAFQKLGNAMSGGPVLESLADALEGISDDEADILLDLTKEDSGSVIGMADPDAPEHAGQFIEEPDGQRMYAKE